MRSYHRIIPWTPLFIFYEPHIYAVCHTHTMYSSKKGKRDHYPQHHPQNFLFNAGLRSLSLFPFVCNNHRSCSLAITPEVTSRIHNLHSAANLLDKVLAEWENNEHCTATAAKLSPYTTFVWLHNTVLSELRRSVFN